ncbi:uncharacterized protein LACBIDRAFT_334352 [Laccaria bicolor S238N-H82]|uniref:Predicted protein n=1 Tax=Laccaria bicolor (strain S238N-H82 / ATCC MYA-4686) TaxID=486041 RepID=B0DYY2_LACBS|nr:uncharacterized protein LACBIDRAFT_334352 [Laccaria bicolor S238N-H82]EDR00244.1 predicted protein [Laccaria bicolor S238N-H82]|eukprot:XP_001889153.1 predicted protein [Laccaria bicolor S238N-H82]
MEFLGFCQESFPEPPGIRPFPLEFLGKKWEFPWNWKPKWLMLQPVAFHRNSMEFHGILTFQWESGGIRRNSWRRVKTSYQLVEHSFSRHNSVWFWVYSITCICLKVIYGSDELSVISEVFCKLSSLTKCSTSYAIHTCDLRSLDNISSALQNTYKELDNANHIINMLRLELASEKVKKSHKGSKSDVPEELLTADQEIAKLAQIYLLFHQPWPSFDFNSSERYSTEGNIMLGASAELYECVPECLHDYMQSHSDFGAKFTKELSSSHSSMIDRLWKNATSIFGLSAECLARKFDCTGNPTIKNLLGYNANGMTVGARYPKLPPFFFQDGCITNWTYLFRSEYLLKLALLIIYGPTVALGSALPVFRSNSPYASRSFRLTRGQKVVENLKFVNGMDFMNNLIYSGIIEKWCCTILEILFIAPKMRNQLVFPAKFGTLERLDYSFPTTTRMSMSFYLWPLCRDHP